MILNASDEQPDPCKTARLSSGSVISLPMNAGTVDLLRPCRIVYSQMHVLGFLARSSYDSFLTRSVEPLSATFHVLVAGSSGQSIAGVGAITSHTKSPACCSLNRRCRTVAVLAAGKRELVQRIADQPSLQRTHRAHQADPSTGSTSQTP
jgi:hypothetical protein